MGRLMGFEPMHIGTTIRGLDHLTTGAIFPTKSSISNKDFKSSISVKKTALFLKAVFLLSSKFNLINSLEHISDTSSC